MKRAIFFLFTLAVAARAQTNAPMPTATATNEPTIINSDSMHGDYVHNVGTFTGRVIVIDPRMSLRADKMTVWFGMVTNVVDSATNATRSIQRVFAEGAVVIDTPDNKKAHSDFAEYTADDGKVILTGTPRVESTDGVVTGQRITFWRGSQKMDVENPTTETNRTRLIIYPEEQRKKE